MRKSMYENDKFCGNYECPCFLYDAPHHCRASVKEPTIEQVEEIVKEIGCNSPDIQKYLGYGPGKSA